MNLVELLAEQSKLRPAANAIIESQGARDQITTFAQLEEYSAKMAALLAKSGIGAGDPVLVFVPMSAELYIVLLGIFRLGAVALFLDPSAGREHIERCCSLLPPKALVATPKAHLLRAVSPALRRIPRKFSSGFPLPGAAPTHRRKTLAPLQEIALRDADAPALVTFTSGSTGLPKAAVRTHGFLLAQHHVLASRIHLVPGEVDMATLPVFLLANLASGVTSVIPDADLRSPGAIKPRPVLSQIARHQVTRCSASPAFFQRLLGSNGEAPESFFGMRKIYTGGAPVFPRLLEDLHQAAPDAVIEAVYGSTEAEPIAHVAYTEIAATDRAEMRRGNGLIAGQPVPEIELCVIRNQWGQAIGPYRADEFEQLRMAVGAPGEITVTGPHVLKGYLGGAGNEETKFAVEGQIWHRTGDMGKFDDQGRLWLLGRCNASIKDERGELHPFSVECVATEYAAIKRAACVSHKGKRILVIEPRARIAEREKAALFRSLAWANLDEIRFVRQLPVDKRHNAKIDYPALRRMLA